jgi:hypothetical protein
MVCQALRVSGIHFLHRTSQCTQARGRKRLPAEDGTGTCAMLKLKDWPPDSDFHLELVRHNQVRGRGVRHSAAC